MKEPPAPFSKWDRAIITINGVQLTRQQNSIVRLAIWEVARQIERGEMDRLGSWHDEIEKIDAMVRGDK